MITILGTSTSASAAPEAAFSADAEGDLGALPSPVAGVADPAGHVTPRGPLILQTTLLGPLTVPDGAARAAEIEELSRRAAMYATRAKGDGTRRAYRSAWGQLAAWCAGISREPLAADPDTIAMYVVRCADQGFAVSSIRVHLAAIKTAHLLAGLSLDLRHPRLAMVVEGVTRSKGIRPRRRAAPAVPGVLRLLLAARPSPDEPIGARDRAMLLLGFGAALRRSELVALTIGDVETVPGRGIMLTIGRSKTDQAGAGQRVAVHANPAEPGCCPAVALDDWLRHRRDAPDLDWTASATMRARRPLFCAVTKTGKVTGEGLSDKAVVRLVKQAAEGAGLDPDKFAGHSLRRGLLTAGADNRAQLPELMRQSRHRSAQSVLGYLEPADLWRNNVTEGVFQQGQEGAPQQREGQQRRS
ncbi:MAG TPA: tyrosine-type recombinase/integrase [Streptosporangiaceae bacterium]|nr:tyrosine-type recombinase/integrase [Streptosporangiaceae bacterium]